MGFFQSLCPKSSYPWALVREMSCCLSVGAPILSFAKYLVMMGWATLVQIFPSHQQLRHCDHEVSGGHAVVAEIDFIG